MKKDPSMSQLLNENREIPFHLVAEHGCLDMVKVAVSYTNTQKYTNNQYETPLFIASREGHLECVRYLLEQYDTSTVIEVKNRGPVS